MRSVGALSFTVLLRLLCHVQQVAAGVNIDGGRSQLPGMKQDMFDQAQQTKKTANQKFGKGPADCPKSDQMSPFWGMAWGSGEIFVKLNSSTDKCSKLITIGGANHTTLQNASRTCGPRGEWKKRISENLSSIFFQGGLDWVRHENETIEIVTEDGTFEVPVTEERYQDMLACWAKGCDCEQVKNPVGRGVLLALAAIAVIGLMSDAVKCAWDKFRDKKPPKHVMSPKGYKMVKEPSPNMKRLCNVSGKRGTVYKCSGGTNYDLSLESYKDAKKKIKTDLETWYKRHPEEKKKDKQLKKDEKDGSDDDDVSKKPESEKSDGETTNTTKSEVEKSDASDNDKSEAESKTDKSEAESKTEKES